MVGASLLGGTLDAASLFLKIVSIGPYENGVPTDTKTGSDPWALESLKPMVCLFTTRSHMCGTEVVSVCRMSVCRR